MTEVETASTLPVTTPDCGVLIVKLPPVLTEPEPPPTYAGVMARTKAPPLALTTE